MVIKKLLPLLFCLSASWAISQTARIENIDWTLSATSLVITYDLESESAEQAYEVSLTLYKDAQQIIPDKGISGALGKGIYAREKQQIYWWYTQDGFQQNDLQDLDVSIQLAPQKDTDQPALVFEGLEELLYFTPGISANTLKKGAIELNLVNALFYDQAIFNFTGAPPYRELEETQRSFTTIIRGMYGVSMQKNLDVGLQISYNSFKLSDTKFSLIKAGPVIRWRPFGAISESLDLTVQNGIGFVLSDPDDIASSQADITNQIILTKYYTKQNLLIQLNAGMNVDGKSSNTTFDRKRALSFPMSFLLGYYPRTNLIFFTGLEHFRTLGTIPWMEDNERYLRQSATSWFVGIQYLVNNTFNLYLIPRFKISDKSGGGANAIVFGASMIIN